MTTALRPFKKLSPFSQLEAPAAGDPIPNFPSSEVNLTWEEFGVAPGGTMLSVCAADDLSYIHVGESLADGCFRRSVDTGDSWSTPAAGGSFGASYIACSADGQYVLATATRYTVWSTDFGANYSAAFDWGYSVATVPAVSASGGVMLQFQQTTARYSTNFGASWLTPATVANVGGNPNKVVMSNDGAYAYAIVGSATGAFGRTDDSCANWTKEFYGPTNVTGVSMCCSGDGQTVWAVGYTTTPTTYHFYKSTDFGATFTEVFPYFDFDINAMAIRDIECNADGSLLVITSAGGITGGFRLAVSNDSGAAFFLTTTPFVSGAYNAKYGIVLSQDKSFGIVIPGAAGNKLRRSPVGAF